MPKSNTPLFSLEAHGSVGGAVTYQGKGGHKISRTKPTLPYFLTLPVQYQRWLYEDYAYLWRQQSAAVKRQYEIDGCPHHLTGYQYWMKYQLRNLPDIAGMWHLDDKGGGVAHDYSRNENHGTIFGASPATGLIDGCLSFDGINDAVSFGPAAFDTLTDCTVEFFSSKGAITGDDVIFSAYKDWLNRINAYYSFADNLFYVFVTVGGVAKGAVTDAPAPSPLNHYAFQLGSGGVKLFLGGILQAITNPSTWSLADIAPTITNHISSIAAAWNWHLGCCDHVIIYNRLLDTTELTRHSLRRWPPE